MGISTAHHLARLLDNGFSPVLIEEGTRKPLERGWQRYCRAPASIATMARLLAKRPDLGVGVALGYDNVFGLDRDTDNAEICHAIGGEFPCDEAPAKVGMIGATFFFRSEGAVGIRHFDGTDGARLVDLLGVGAQSVVPPSRYFLKDGDDGVVRHYRWLGGRTLFNTHVSELPLIRGDAAARLARVLAPFMPPPKPAAPVIAARPTADLTDKERVRMGLRADAALKAFENMLKAQQKPGRSNLIFGMGAELAGYVREGFLTEDEILKAAIEGADANGFLKEAGAGRVGRDLAAGLKKGQNRPLRALENDPYRRGRR